jgi:hypothetical protein
MTGVSGWHQAERSSRSPTTATAAEASDPSLLLSGDLFLRLRRPMDATGAHVEAARARRMNFMVGVEYCCSERSMLVMICEIGFRNYDMITMRPEGIFRRSSWVEV